MCPVRQYNKDKPDPYRIDFFILADHPPNNINNMRTGYLVLHLDVYQGANAAKVNIDDRAAAIPTTMRAVVNAVYQLGIQNDTVHGYRTIAMDSRYQCPELAFILRERCHILSTGTCRHNHKGWPKEKLQMKKSKEGVLNHGDLFVYYDKVNDIIAFQWMDTRVVNCCSTIIDNTLLEASRHVGPSFVYLPVPRPLKTYHQYMNTVDKGDQGRLQMGGFARKAHFQKWYKKLCFAVVDFMLMNGLVAWYLSCLLDDIRCQPFRRYEFHMWIAQNFLNYQDDKDKSCGSVAGEINSAAGSATIQSEERTVQKCSLIAPTGRHHRCIVCRLDAGHSHNFKGLKKLILFCKGCGVHVHHHEMVDGETRAIHEHFPGMTCHDILSCSTGQEIWKFNDENRRSIAYSHSIICKLMDRYRMQLQRGNPTRDEASILL